MAEREPGLYWVRDRFDDDWVVALWSGSAWLLHGDTTEYKDGAFLEIGPRAEMPPPVVVMDTPQLPEVVHYNLNTPERKRALMAAFKLPEWPEPQPITDAQKTGERFLVWATPVNVSRLHPHNDPMKESGWLTAFWDGYWIVGGNETGEGFSLDDDRVTRYLPLPPDVMP